MNLLMNPWVLLGIGVAFLGSLYGAYNHGVTVTEGAYALAAQEGRKARDEALAAAAKEIVKIDVKYVTIKQTLEKEVHEKLVYTECRNTDSGMQLINSALTNTTLAAGDSKLPTTNSIK